MNAAEFFKNLPENNTKPEVKLMLETGFTKEIRIFFQPGQEMKEHSSHFPIVVSVLEGEIDFGAEQNRLTLTKGMIVALDADVKHHLLAKQKSIVRLTLVKADEVQRVKDVGNR